MDPNLEKIKAVCLEDVAKGRTPRNKAFATATWSAEDYLKTILGEHDLRISKELSEFSQTLRKELDNGSQR